MHARRCFLGGGAMMIALAGVLAASAAVFSAEDVVAERAGKDQWMRDNPQSPFNNEAHRVAFSPLRYFPPDASWVFESTLTVYPEPEAVTILDTKGRERKGDVFGFLSFTREGVTQTVRVYRMRMVGGHPYYAIWFTDRTTGESTYDVGRYLDFEYTPDPAHVYRLDFNAAYNPYCAYTPAYGCPIPRREDFLDLAVTAGEKTWHD